MDTGREEVEFLARSAHRVEVLSTLADGPQNRAHLSHKTGASSPTMGRVLTDFEDRHWIERTGNTYRLTDLGRFVAEHVESLLEAMTTERRLREIWPWLPHAVEGFGVELFTDVVVSRPGPGYPYEPIERLTQLISETSTMRGFGMAVLKSGNLRPFFERTHNGLEVEYIYPPAVFEQLLSWNREVVTAATRRENYTVLLHEELPLDERCGICLFDDRVSICCYDHETGTLQSLVDTESEAMRTWAKSYYQRFRQEAAPLEAAADIGSTESIQ